MAEPAADAVIPANNMESPTDDAGNESVREDSTIRAPMGSLCDGGGPYEKHFINAKSFLLTDSKRTGLNLYNHLTAVLKQILKEQPADVTDVLEDISCIVKREKFTSGTSTIQDDPAMSTEVALAFIQANLFGGAQNDEEEAAIEEDAETPLPNLLELAFFFEQSGFGLNREEMYRVWLAMKALAKTLPLDSIRFWGKIFGIEQNYYIAEVEFQEGEGEEVEEQVEEEEKEEEEEPKPEDQEGAEEGIVEDEIPQPKWEPPPVVPTEELGTGVNKKVYFVCNDPGKPWKRLPKATPAQIQCARQITKYFSGHLENTIISYPPFPGLENNYLRAQIARISSGTQVSPLGLFQFDTEEEEEEEGMGQDTAFRSPDFEGLALSELIDPTLENWVHHIKFILPQGRCTWWNPKPMDEEMMEEEQEEGPEPEIGLPLLQPLAEDKSVNGQSPWTVRLSSKQVPQYAHGYISSNLWPGAFAFSSGKSFENIYVGWGRKYSASNYTPPPPPPVFKEYRWGPDLVEVDDPTPQEEADLKALLEPPPPPEGEEEAKMEEEEEEEEEDED